MPTDLALAARMGAGFGSGFVLGFEREIRGSPAGDRTFAVLGATAAGVTAVAFRQSPQAVAGIMTGIGFIGAGVFIRGDRGMIKGLTTAATIFAVAGTGIVMGTARFVLGAIMTGALLVALELPHIPVLRRLDARLYSGMVHADDEVHDRPPHGDGPA
jgi:putative Mg2+ transporter-C (MgtC) family protein